MPFLAFKLARKGALFLILILPGLLIGAFPNASAQVDKFECPKTYVTNGVTYILRFEADYREGTVNFPSEFECDYEAEDLFDAKTSDGRSVAATFGFNLVFAEPGKPVVKKGIDWCSTANDRDYSPQNIRHVIVTSTDIKAKVTAGAVRNHDKSDILEHADKLFQEVAPYAKSCDGSTVSTAEPSEEQATKEERGDSKEESGNEVSTQCKSEETGEVVGKFVGVYENVEVRPAGSSEWYQVELGVPVRQGDEIRVEGKGGARVEWKDRNPNDNAGPSVVNIGADTNFCVQDYITGYDGEGEPKQEGYFELLKGKIREIAEGWGKHSIFSVKGGVSLVGIRGSDVVIDYDPEQERVSVFVKEGEVSVKSTTAGNVKTVTGGQSIVVENGHINPPTEMPDLAWQAAANNLEIPEGTQARAQEPEQESQQPEDALDEIVSTPEAGGGCLIATSAYGSELSPKIQQLREIRDNIVMSTESGKAFLSGFNQLYYSFSPTVADWERQNPFFKEGVKTFLAPMLTTLPIMNFAEKGSESQVITLGISVIVLNIGMYIATPTVTIWQVKKRINNKN